METLLVKIFATALALSQVTTTPDTVKTQFDRARDQDQVAQLLRAGCAHMRKAFDIEDINLDELIATALDDPQAIAGESRAFRGINFADLQTTYRQFCKNETVATPAVDLGDVIDFYNKAAADLPDHTKLKGLKLPGASVVLDRKGERFAEVFEENQRRVWVVLADIPQHVQKAFIAAEDKRFYQHKGIDERGLIRAFIGNLAQSGRPAGRLDHHPADREEPAGRRGPHLRAQNPRDDRGVAGRAGLAQGGDSRALSQLRLSRPRLLGHRARRTQLFRQAGEGARACDEGALLAGLTKGPNYFNPDRHPGRAQERLAYVLSRMQEDGAATPARPAQPGTAGSCRRSWPMNGRAATSGSTSSIRSRAKPSRWPASMRSRRILTPCVRPSIRNCSGRWRRPCRRGSRATSAAPAAFSSAPPRPIYREAVQRIDADKKGDRRPAWQQALASARLPLYDVHWTPAIVVEKPGGKKSEAWRVGLADGRILPLSIDNAVAQRKLALYDVVLVRLADGKGKAAARAELRVRPVVQGAVVVLENKTGRILAMTGGFSYPLSQLNRATQAVRQPGSAIKPLSYLAALGKGLQPNTLVMDEPITLPPIGGGRAREQDYWTPKNYDGGSGDTLTLRRALENSRNLATVHLLDGGIEKKPEASLNRLCDLAIEAQIYRECVRYYPFVLGAQPVRPIDLAAFYAAIANEGLRPLPHSVDSIDRDGQTIYRYQQTTSGTISSVDRAAFYQLKSMMQGVLARGTARAISGLAPYVAGKTGTSDEENDAWFVGFTNDVTVAVWLGYDNADGKRRTLGGGATGGGVAVPIFEPIIQAVWAHVASKTALAPPSPEARRQLTCKSVNLDSGEMQSSRGKTVSECLRVDAKGKVIDTQYRLVSRDSTYTRRDREDGPARPKRDDTAVRSRNERPYSYQDGWSRDPWRGAPQWDSRWDYGQRWRDQQQEWRRVDPNGSWGYRRW